MRRSLPAALALLWSACQAPEPAAPPRAPNRLIHETSAYLLGHAHDPIDWYPWGDEAFARAQRDDKLVLLSIGYASCHWCHVMAQEAFQDEAIARQLSEGFVAIKVDREERPDLDAIYLAAVQRLTGGAGGWPLTVILLPDRRPIFGASYLPPHDRPGQPGLSTVLARARRAYAEERAGLGARASTLVDVLGEAGPVAGAAPGAASIRAAVATYAAAFDPDAGGFERAPRFPRPAALALLLRYHRRTGDRSALDMARHTLARLAAGGIYDQLGGGFHRYAIDDRWQVPHFEKMLTDNAQLAAVYLEAYQLTRDPALARVARETLDFVLGELAVPGGGFAASLDADTDGAEGRYYTWTPAEIDRAIGPERGRVVRAAYAVTPEGILPGGRSVLWRPQATTGGAAALDATLEEARRALAAARGRRVRPRRDATCVVGWNALAVTALARGALVLDEPRYLAAARAAARFVLERARTSDGRLAHQWASGRAAGAAFLDDVALLEAALLDLLEADPDPDWLRQASALQRELDARFADPRGGYFFTPADHEVLLRRDKPARDDPTPAGNSVAALAALRLATLTGDAALRARAEATLVAFAGTLARAPAAMPAMLAAVDYALDRVKQLVLVVPPGADPAGLLGPVRSTFWPNRVLVRDDGTGRLGSPLVAGKTARGGRPTAYLCEGDRCDRPTSDPAELARQLARVEPL